MTAALIVAAAFATVVVVSVYTAVAGERVDAVINAREEHDDDESGC